MNTIDLSQLPAPEVVEPLDYETILASMKADLIGRDQTLADALQLESEPLVKLLEVCAYRELLLRQRINDASRSVMLAYAIGNGLDHLAVLFGVERQCIDTGDEQAMPPILPTYEDDNRLRRRIQLSHQRYSTAGSEGAYRFWALSASPDVKAVDVHSPTPGVVVVTILSNQGDGTAFDVLLNQVSQVLNADDVRPLCDRVVVQSASIEAYMVNAQLVVDPGPDAEVVRLAAEQVVKNYATQQHRLGQSIRLSALYAALHQSGVQQVTLNEPTDDITLDNHQAPFCQSVTITIAVSDNSDDNGQSS